MFALFYSLYISMFLGNWTLYNQSQATNSFAKALNYIGKLLTSIFNQVSTPYETFGDDMNLYIWQFVSYILALITSIGIVVVATKGIKKIFTVFFYGVR